MAGVPMNPIEDERPLPENAGSPDSFIDKWLARWPEWAVVQVFVPASQRQTWLAWAALQQELGDAAWGGADARPGEAKLGWWQEELQGWSRGLRRHPLGALLQAQPADWRGLADVLPALRDSRGRPADAADAQRQVESIARAFARIDAALDGAGHASPFVSPAPDGVALATQQLLHARLQLAGEMAVPLQELARAGHGDPVAPWATRVPTLTGDPTHSGRSGRSADRGGGSSGRTAVPHFRRITATLAQRRLARGDAARPLPAWRALWAAWQAARN